ncbi:hypothetical protein MJH12_03545, partial [bacterium]|nr:hypothetical protein [bacterium]
LEMYNLDNGENATLGELTGRFKALVEGKYMQSSPDDPGCKKATSGDEGSSNYDSNSDGDVWCAFHGTVDGKCIGTSCVGTGSASCGGGA